MADRLRDEPGFVRWATAEGVSTVGTSITTVVLPLVVYEQTGSAAQTGLLYAMRVVPYLLFGVIAGPIADRGNRRLLIIGGSAAQGLLVATIPIAHELGALTLAHVYVVALASATVFVFADAAVFGAVPALVGPARLPAANGFLSSLLSGAEIVGPALAGILAATIGATNAVWVDAASFFVAALVLRTIRSSFRSDDAPRARIAIREQVGRALGFVRRQRTLATLLVIGFGNSMAVGAVLGLTVPYAVERLGLSDDDGRIGLLYSAGGVGALIAGLTFNRLFRIGRIHWLVPLTMAISSTVIAGLIGATAWGVAAVLLGAFLWSVGTTITTGITYRQLVAPDDLRSSVNVLGRMIAWGGQPFGAALGALIAGTRSVHAAYVGAFVVMAVTTVVGAVALGRARRHEPQSSLAR